MQNLEIPDSQQYPLNFYLINDNAQVTLIIHTGADKAFMGIIVNRAMPSLHLRLHFI